MFARNPNPDFAQFGGFGHFGGGRMGRGMMEPTILRVLTNKPMHGYEIISTLEARSHGMWRPSPGSVYPTLQLLEEKGFVTVSEQDGKKVYTLTDDGRTEAEQTDVHEEKWHDRREAFKEMHAMRESVMDVMRTMRTIQRHGSDEQKERMGSALDHLRSELYSIVGEKE